MAQFFHRFSVFYRGKKREVLNGGKSIKIKIKILSQLT